MIKETERRLTFTLEPTPELNVVLIQNREEEKLGYLQKIRVGAWMTWCLFLKEDCYLSAGCQDEVREKTKELNATSNKKENKDGI